MTIQIYLITNTYLIPNKYYVGQTKNSLEERFNSHIKLGRRENNGLLHKALLKYGTINFTIELLEKVSEIDSKQKETYYIKKYKSHFREGGGYNMKYETNDYVKKYHSGDMNIILSNIENGIKWNKNIPFSEESKIKMAETKKYRQDLGLYTKYGHTHSEETKILLSEIAKNRPPPTEKTRKKLSINSSNRIWVYSIILKKRKFVKKENVPDGWIIGKGSVWVHNYLESKCIPIWDKEHYIKELYYIEGRINVRTDN